MNTTDDTTTPQTAAQHTDGTGTAPTPLDAQQPPQEPAQSPADDTDSTSGADDTNDTDDTDDTDTDPGKREAIRYRRRLREAEAERDALAEKVAGLTRTIVSDIVAAEISPEAFFLAGHDPADFLDEEGAVRRAELDAAVSDVASRLELRHRARPGDPGQGARGITPEPPSLRDAFRRVR